MALPVIALSSLVVALSTAASIMCLAIESHATGEVWGYYGSFSRERQPAMFAFYMGNFFGIFVLAAVVFAMAVDALMA